MERSNHEISVEQFMATVQNEMIRRRNTDKVNCQSDHYDSQTEKSFLDWNHIDSNLIFADRNIHIGTRDFTMLRFGRSTRWLAKFVSRFVQYISRVVTFQQIEFNQTIVVLLRTVFNGFRQFETMTNLLKKEINEQKLCDEQLGAQIAAQNDLLKGYAAQIQDQTKQIEKYDELVTKQKHEIDELKNLASYASSRISIQEQMFCKLADNMHDIYSGKQNASKLKEILDETNHIWDPLYVKFEDQFRGTRDEIKKRLEVYLPIIKNGGAGTEEYPLLDIACGRGEWLELLREKGLIGKGVDFNRSAIDQCKKFNLNVIEDDTFNYLKRLPDSLYGAVTAFHFIEHLSFPELIKFIDESIRILKPNGILIFETPNSENVIVGANTFYMDPTHRNPLPYQLIKFLVEDRGIVNTEILKLNPYEKELRIEGSSLLESRFNDYFYGPRDYAIVGFKKETPLIKDLPE